MNDGVLQIRELAKLSPSGMLSAATCLLSDSEIQRAISGGLAEKYGVVSEVRRLGAADLVRRFRAGCPAAKEMLLNNPQNLHLKNIADFARRLNAEGK